MSEYTLKPCPFCGGTDLQLSNTHTPCFCVDCRDCEVRKWGDYFDGPRRRTRFGYDPEADPADKCSARTIGELHPEYRKAAFSAIGAWNERARDAAVAELIAADMEYDAAHRAWKNGGGGAAIERWYTAKERRAAVLAALNSGATPT